MNRIPAGASCKTCAFWKPLVPAGTAECHRNPPQVVVERVIKHYAPSPFVHQIMPSAEHTPAQPVYEDRVVTLWPRPAPSEVCGEYEYDPC